MALEHTCTPERELAKTASHDIGIEDHGFMVMYGIFEYEDGGAQGWGVQIDLDFVRGILGVFGVDKLRQVNGKSCWVTHCASRIHRVEPLHKKDGVPFDVDAWTSNIDKKHTARA